MTPRFFRLLLAILTLFCATTTMAQNRAGNEVSGTLTIGEGASAQKIELKHVYASIAHQYRGSDNSLFLVFTDKPLPGDPVERLNYLSVMTQAGKLAVLHVEIYRKEVRGSYAMCGSCQTASGIVGSKAYYSNGEEREMREEDDVGGGMIGKAYLDYKRQEQGDPFNTIRLAQPRIVRCLVNGDRATLTVHDDDEVYTIRMVLEGGKWKPASEKLTDIKVR